MIMHKRVLLLGLMLGLFSQLGLALAHHTAAGPSSGMSPTATSFLLRDGSVKPASRFFLTQEFRAVDDDLGQVHTSVFGGEWAIHPRVSVTGEAGLVHVDQTGVGSETGFGDVALQPRVLLWNAKSSFSFVSSRLSLPTGDEGRGLGRGAVSQDAVWLVGVKSQGWTGFAATGMQFGYASHPEASHVVSLGAQSPEFFKRRLSAGLALSALTYLDSSSFAAGSGKLSLEPGLQIGVDGKKKWLINLGGRLSLADYLRVKNGVTLSATSHAVLSDALFSATASLNYFFK